MIRTSVLSRHCTKKVKNTRIYPEKKRQENREQETIDTDVGMSKLNEKSYVAPQNSVTEFKIPRYNVNRYLESNSAPPTINTTPIQTSREASKDSLSPNEPTQMKQHEALLEEPVTYKRSLQNAISINNNLKMRLYNHPMHSQVLQHNKFTPHPPYKQHGERSGYNTFHSGRKSILSKQRKNRYKYDADKSIISKKPPIADSKEEVPSPTLYSDMDTEAEEEVERNCITGRKMYEGQNILEIIHALFKRLNWQCDGILSGDIPNDTTGECVDTTNVQKDDDGEFVYCVARDYFSPTARYNPYDLIYVSPKKLHNYEVYYTISATYVSKICVDDGTTLVPVLDFLCERKLFYKVFNLKFFEQFRIWKTWTTWKRILRHEKTEESRVVLEKILFSANSTFQDTILEVRSICQSVCELSPACESLVKFNINQTYTLEDFCNIQMEQCCHVKNLLLNYRKHIIGLVYDACQKYYAEDVNNINTNIKEMERNELLRETGYKQQQYKNFQLIKEKYSIVEKNLPEHSNTNGEIKIGLFKYIKDVHIKSITIRLRSFVRMIDFIIQDMLRALVLSALHVLQVQILAAFNMEKQPDLRDVCEWKFHNVKEDVTVTEVTKIAKPLFEVQLVLKSGKPGSNENQKVAFREAAKIINTPQISSSVLCPSLQEFETRISALIQSLESTVCEFKSLKTEPALHKFIDEPSNILNIDQYEKKLCENSYKLWPDKELLFGEDLLYQGCVADLMSNIRSGMEQVQSYAKQFDVFCDMVATSNLKQVHGSFKVEWTTEQFYTVLEQYNDQIISMEKIPTSGRRALYLVKTDAFKKACLPFPKRIINVVNAYLPKVANSKNEALLKIIKDGETRLSAPIESVEEFVDHLTYLSQLSEEIPKLEKEFHIILRLFEIAFNYDSHFTAEEKASYQTLRPNFQQLKNLVIYCEAKKDENIVKFSKDLDTIVGNLDKQLQSLTIQIQNPSLLEEDMTSLHALEAIHFMKEDLETLSESAKSFLAYESCFTSALSSSFKKRTFQTMQTQYTSKSVFKVAQLQDEISIAEKDLMLRQLLWESLEQWSTLHQKWRATTFSVLDVANLQKEVSRFVQAIYLLEKGLPANSMVPRLKKDIMLFNMGMPVVSSLRNPALKQRHWEDIHNVTGSVIKDEKHFTLGKVIDSVIFQHEERISEISVQASNEATLEQMLNKVKELWKTTDLQLHAHTSRDVAIITGVDKILTSLDDSMVTLANVRGSRFCLPFQAQVNEWDHKLSLFLRTFEEWILVQRNWLYLESVFAASDIQRQLPNEAKLFTQVDKTWRGIMRQAIDHPNALAAATSSGLLDVLQACNSTLEKIHRSLEEYLDTKRLVFSRFYFLSNDELLDILANSKEVTAVQSYLPKCFGNIKTLNFDMKHKSPFPICGITSNEGEYMELPKSLKARGQVEQWLVSVENAMFDTVKSHLEKALPDFSHDDFVEWMLGCYGQIVLTVMQVVFSSDVNNALQSDTVTPALHAIMRQVSSKLDVLAEYVKKSLPEHKRNVAVALIINLVHDRDILYTLTDHAVEEVEDFHWIKQLRYRWDEQANNCFVEQSISSTLYGYEYLGCSSRLVITPLTDRCYLTLTGALHFHLGGAPSGPAGTGKSETVKDLAKTMGKQCIVFNCSEGIDFHMIGRFLSGVSQSGSWCCFDEFNRIDLEVLSVIAQQLHVIKAAKMSSSDRFMFEGRDIRLNSTSGVFITMNPGYAGRVELPDNLKSMFRPVSMVTPDNRLIAEIILFSNGFSTAAVLSRKLINIYELAKKQLSQQHHYDFGLRAIKAVLTMAGEHNRKSMHNISSQYHSNEEAIFIRAIRDSNYPKLIYEDLKLFQQFLQDVFPETKIAVSDPVILEKYVKIALQELSLQIWPSQVQKVIQFHNTLNIRHGVMLVGPTAGGKTTILKLLRHSLIIQEGGHRSDQDDLKFGEESQKDDSKSSTVDMVTINPKSITLGELYGEFDSNTTEWTDGLLSSTVRHFVAQNADSQRSPSKSKKQFSQLADASSMRTLPSTKSLHQWIVLDGPVDTLWIENLNTMLDDSKLLCLANGERISMLPNMRVIFEVDNLTEASPATISRCGMIYMDPSELGWQPSVKTWLNKISDLQVLQDELDHLWSLFTVTVEPGLQFLEQNVQHLLINVPALSIVNLLCNLLESFLKHISNEGGFKKEDIVKEKETDEDEHGKKYMLDFSNLLSNYKSNHKKGNKKNLLKEHPELLKPLLNKLYLFCYMWSFGGHFHCFSEEAEEIEKNCYVPNFQMENDVNARHIFDAFLRNLFETNFDMALPGGTHLMYSYYVDLDKVQFLLWDHLVINATQRPWEEDMTHSLMNDIENGDKLLKKNNLIPTPHTICYSFLIALLTLNEHPVLLSGTTGVGKTALLQDILLRLAEPGGCAVSETSILGSVFSSKMEMDRSLFSLSDVVMNKKLSNLNEKITISHFVFFASTNADQAKSVFETKLVKRGRDVLGTKQGEKVIVFVDDLNMPLPDTFGSQPPLEVLREYLDHGGFYDTKHLHWKQIFNVTLLAAYGIKAGDTKQKQNDRLIQKFNTLCLPLPSSQSLHHIYHTQLSRFFDSSEFSSEVISLQSVIVSTVLGIYHEIFSALKATPAKSHYLFNLRDISKVLNGLMHAHPSAIKTKDDFVELLIHEVSRVFLDRLVTENDRTFFRETVLDQVHNFLKLKWSRDRLFRNNVMFGDYFEPNLHATKRVYQYLRDRNKILQIIEDYNDRGKLAGKNVPDNLVLFPSMCEHINAAARVLRQVGGHLLLLGIGGTGKTSVVRLASYMELCEFIQPEITRNYSLSDFKEDIRKGMVKAGLQGVKVVFFLNDRNIVKESFLELICAVLSAQDLSMFFDNEYRENIITELKSDAHAHNISDTKDAVFEFFTSRVKQNLHVVFSTSPSGSLFHKRCQLYPTLINNCTIDWYDKWPTEALYTVASRYLIDMKIVTYESVTEVLVYTHTSIEDMCHQFLVEMKRHYHVTPTSFLNFMQLFKHVYETKTFKQVYEQERLLSGLRKLDETNALVEEMKVELSSLGPQLEQKAKDTEELMKEIVKDQGQFNKVKAVVKKEQEVMDHETKKVEAVAFEAQSDLDKALPQLEQATIALDSLNKYDIGEIRSYANPPTMVMTVLSAVCVTLNENPDWSTAKLLLADPHFLKKLINYDHDNVPDKILTKLKRYTKQASFNPATVGKISVACKSMCSWVLALERYSNVHRMVKPKQLKCEEAQKALSEAREQLSVKESFLKRVVDQLKELERRHQENVAQLEQLESSKQLTIRRLGRAASLIEALTSEKDRWLHAVQELKKNSTSLLSEAIMIAASATYLGPFIPSYRSYFTERLQRKIKEHGIMITDDFDLASVMVNPTEIRNWRISGLPHDNHSTENAMFAKYTHQWPYIIDPQQQAFKWIKEQEKVNSLNIVQANDVHLMRTLENSIRLGGVVIIQNAAEVLEPVLDPILNRKLNKRGNQLLITLGDTEIEYNDAFKLYMLTEIENPKLLPELCIKVTVINFIISMEGLTDQVLSEVVLQENAKLEEQKNTVLELLVSEKLRLTELENHSLNLLHNSKGIMLDDEDLIKTLDDSKHIAEGIRLKVLDAEKSEEELARKREVYLRLAERGALLYFVAADMSSVDGVYQFSLSWFVELFCKCISTTDEKEKIESRPSSARSRLDQAKEFASASNLEKRKMSFLYSLKEGNEESYMRAMMNVVTETFYKVVSYALFARHQLLFAFHLTSKLLLHGHDKGECSELKTTEYNLLLNKYSLLKKASDIVTTSMPDSSIPPITISATQWNECLHLSDVLPCFEDLESHMRIYHEKWSNFMLSAKPLDYFDELSEDLASPSFCPSSLTSFQKLLLLKILRPDQFTVGISSFISLTMGKQFITPSGFDLQDLYAESNCRTPLMFILSPGSDPSSQLLRFVKEVRGSTLHLDMISLGRSQGPKALAAIKRAYTQRGSWVFLQNCHLALSFMSKLEEVVKELSDPDVAVNSQFRLWLSSKPDPLLPVSILQSSMKVTVEPPPGVRSNLQSTFAAVGGVVTESLFEDETIHRSWKQLLYSSCFFHAVVQERKMFGSLGWNLNYDFVSSDLEVAVLTLQDILSRFKTVPWQALQILTGEIIYGGRVTDKWDLRCLLSLLKRFYTSELLHPGFTYFQSNAYVPPKKNDTFYDCVSMIENFPTTDCAQIFGMNENAMYERCRDEGGQLIEQLHLMRPNVQSTESANIANEEYLRQHIEDILHMLPDKMEVVLPRVHFKSTSAPPHVLSDLKGHDLLSAAETEKKDCAVQSAIITALHQEERRFNVLLAVIRTTLLSLKQGLKGESLITEAHESISKSILQNKIPLVWQSHSFKSKKYLASWVINLKKRVAFVSRWIESIAYNDPVLVAPLRSVWLPALFYPLGVLTAILQNHGRKIGVSVDALTFTYYVTDEMWTNEETCSDRDVEPINIGFKTGSVTDNGVRVFGLHLDGACWDRKQRSITKSKIGRRTSPLPEIQFIPQQKSLFEPSEVEESSGGHYECPVYHTSTRRNDANLNFSDFITSILLPTKLPPKEWVLNGVAVLCQTDD